MPVSDPSIIDLTLGEVKFKLPDEYNGDRSKLDTFLAQCELFFAFNTNKFKNETQRILQIITLLRGLAFDQISPFLIDYTKYKTQVRECIKAMRKDIIMYLYTIEGFGNGIRQVFGNIDEVATAEWDLNRFKQKGLMVKYSAEFQQKVAHVKWGLVALRYQFYIGLKDAIKDEIARSD